MRKPCLRERCEPEDLNDGRTCGRLDGRQTREGWLLLEKTNPTAVAIRMEIWIRGMPYSDVRDVLCYTIHAITQSVGDIRDGQGFGDTESEQ